MLHGHRQTDSSLSYAAENDTDSGRAWILHWSWGQREGSITPVTGNLSVQHDWASSISRLATFRPSFSRSVVLRVMAVAGKSVKEMVREVAAKTINAVKKKSALWDHFVEMKGDFTKAWCIHCGEIVPRGKEGTSRRKCFNYRMQYHLKSEHKALMKVLRNTNMQLTNIITL